MNSSSLHEAISKINRGQMGSTANFLIGASEGENAGLAMSVEVSPYGIDVLENNEGTTVHTNHICSSELKNHVKDMNEFIFEDSMIRKRRAEQLVFGNTHERKAINEQSFKEWFSDKFNYPNSINHYENENVPEHRRMETVFSSVMNLTKKQMHVCVGKPSPDGYEIV